MPPLHRFRAWNLQQEQIYLQEQWQHCVVNPTTIPSQDINVYEKNGNPIQKKTLNTLKFPPKIKLQLNVKKTLTVDQMIKCQQLPIKVKDSRK